MGFVEPKQTTAGIHTRLYSRAFVIEDAAVVKNKAKRIVYVTVDVSFISQVVRKRAIDALKSKYGDLYK